MLSVVEAEDSEVAEGLGVGEDVVIWSLPCRAVVTLLLPPEEAGCRLLLVGSVALGGLPVSILSVLGALGLVGPPLRSPL